VNGRPRPPRGIEVQDSTDFRLIRSTPALRALRHQRRSPAFAVAGAAVAFYMLCAVLASEAPGLMGVEIAAHLNLGLCLGLLQCCTTVGVVVWYARHARRRIDPARLRKTIERTGTDR
jgi:uncharacterized membrane protein (DUF485 family)